MTKPRFSKAGMIADLRARADEIATEHGFADRTGYVQTRIGAASEKKLIKATHEDVEQLMWYAKWQQCLELARWIEEGEFGDGVNR